MGKLYGFGLIAVFSYVLGSLPLERLSIHVKALAGRCGLNAARFERMGKLGRKLAPLLSAGPSVVINLCKGFLPVLATSCLLGSHMGTLIAGLFVVLGHTWPFLGFFPRQKGVSVAIGAMALVAPVSAAALVGLWAVVFAFTRYASISWVASFGALPLILYIARRRDVFVIYGIIMSAISVIQMAGGLARISEGKIVHSEDEGPFVDEGDENGDTEDEPVRRKRTGLRVAAGILAALTVTLWFGNKYVYRGFGLQIDVIRCGSPDLKVVALTFDDGPDPLYTPRILDILKQEHVPATFFLVGRHVEKFPDVAKRIVEEGHCVGSHSYSHVNMPLLTREKAIEEIEKSENAIERVCGVHPHLFRPPRGLATGAVRRILRERRYTTVLWSLSSQDWAEPSYREIVSTCNRASNGEIILFHDSGSLVSSEGGSRENTIKALPIVIRNLKAKGFRFVTIDELIVLSDLAAPVEAAE